MATTIKQERTANEFRLEECTLKYKNFSGKQTEFNALGNREFSIVLDDPDFIELLYHEGWNVKVTGDPGRESYHLPVKVNFDSDWPPRVYADRQKGMLQLNGDTVAMLDYQPIKMADVVVNPYHWSMNGKQGVKAYLKLLYATIDEDEFDLKYQHRPVIDLNPVELRAEMEQDQEVGE